MWSPTHVQLTVQKARGLITKGKHGTNHAFVTIALGKDKYQTSLKEKASDVIEWHEKCELQIPKQGNTAEITLTALHRNMFGIDEFLGYISIPLASFDVYERPKNKWYELKDKPGKDKKKDRGELEVKIAFIVKSGSLADLSKKEKHKSSLGGSLISISSLDKRKGLKKFASKIGKKVKSPKKGEGGDVENTQANMGLSRQLPGDADPGVISEGESEDGFTLDELSHKGSGCSLEITPETPTAARGANNSSNGSLENLAGGELLRRSSVTSLPTPALTPPSKPPRIVPPPQTNSEKDKKFDEWEQKLYGKHGKDSKSSFSPSVFNRNTMERIIIGGETEKSPVQSSSRLPQEVLKKYEGKTREDLIDMIIQLESQLNENHTQQKDLEDYLDNLLLRVMETSPRILQNPYINCKTQAQIM